MGADFIELWKVYRLVSKDINSGLYIFSMTKNHPKYVSQVVVLHKLKKRNAAFKRSRKIYKKAIIVLT